MRGNFVAAAAAIIVLVVVVVFFVKKPTTDNLMTAATSSDATGSIPTPQYLFEHPDMLKDAEQKCRDGGAASSLYCSNVHKAESLRMADQYRRALQSKGGAQ
jgi:hypothetical protein